MLKIAPAGYLAAPVAKKLAPGKLHYIYELTVQNEILPFGAVVE